MKTLIVVMCALIGMSVGCAAKDYPILHPDQQEATKKDYPCGLHAYQYQVVMPVDSWDYDYMLVRDGHYYRVKKVCCPEGYSPNYDRPGFCR